MPTYNYISTKCQKEKEAFHPISEIGNLTEETLQSMRCEGCNCIEFEKQLTIPALLGFHNGTSHKVDSSELGEARKKDRLRRSAKDFKKNILPTLPPDEKAHHEKRLKDI